MSTTYFNTKKSNIERLKKKSKKNKDNDKNIENDDKDKNNDDKDKNNNDKDKKVVETFTMNPFSGEKNDTASDDKSEKETDPAGNVFSSSDNASPTSKTETNTAKSAKEQLDSDKFIIFFLHALMCVFLAYVWGFLATNYLYLSSESKDNLDFILPVDEYKLPYTNDPDSKSWYEYGVPYSLGFGRSINSQKQGGSIGEIKHRQKGITYFMWLSKTAESNNCTGIYEVDSFGALNQYIFEVVYGGLARGGRGIIRTLLSLVGVANKDLKDDEDSWNQMKDSFPRKAIAFILFPFIALNFLVPAMAICSGIAAFLSGIFQEHIWWGLFFSFTIGIFISMATGFYMGIQTLYVFFLYPWVNNRTSDKNKWSDIFNSLKTYMLFAFYLLICFYGYEDLGSAGGAGIMFIVVASIIMQWMKNSDDK
jgi:hypothetical protein